MKNTLSHILPLALVAIVFALTTAASAQYTETILYSFGAVENDGWNPGSGPITDAQGNLYGTTGLGGAHDLGSVYELSPNSTGGWTETVLYSFAGGTDGAYPNQLTFTDGNLFGTTFYGGKSGGSVCGNLGCGTLFELSPSSGGGWSEQVLYRFQAGTGGYFPDGKLVFDSNGNLFGTTYYGGASPKT